MSVVVLLMLMVKLSSVAVIPAQKEDWKKLKLNPADMEQQQGVLMK